SIGSTSLEELRHLSVAQSANRTAGTRPHPLNGRTLSVLQKVAEVRLTPSEAWRQHASDATTPRSRLEDRREFWVRDDRYCLATGSRPLPQAAPAICRKTSRGIRTRCQ